MNLSAACAMLTHHNQLTLLMDLEGALVPFWTVTEPARLDRAVTNLLDALHHSGLRVIVATAHTRQLVQPLCEAVRHVCWVTDHGRWQRDELGQWNEASVRSGSHRERELRRCEGVERPELRRSENKNLAVAWVRERAPGARMIAMGNDDTDQAMFAALGDDELAICVGPQRPSRPCCWLSGPSAVRSFLWSLIAARGPGVKGVIVAVT